MATRYGILGQISPQISQVSITNKALTNGVATLTTSASHSLVTDQIVSISLSNPDQAFDGLRTITTTTSNTFSFVSANSNIASASATGVANGIEWTTLYTCPENVSMVSSTLVICNRAISAGYYLIAITDTPSGNPPPESIITAGDIAAGRETVFLTAGLISDETYKYIRVAASNNNFSFQLHGSEIS
jgi:hypothetical protein